MRLIAGKGTVQTYIAYVDDAEYAQQLLRSMLLCAHGQDAHWVLVACAPRITHRVSKFVSNRSRENWRNKWADRLFQSCLPVLQAQGVQVTPMLAKSPCQSCSKACWLSTAAARKSSTCAAPRMPYRPRPPHLFCASWLAH